MKERIWERDKWEGNTRVLLFSRNETQINHCSIAFALLDMYGRNKERMEARYLAGRQSGVANFLFRRSRSSYSEHGVMLAPLFPCFFSPPQLFERGRKERKKERKEDGWDVCSIVFPLFFFFEPGIVGWIISCSICEMRLGYFMWTRSGMMMND